TDPNAAAAQRLANLWAVQSGSYANKLDQAGIQASIANLVKQQDIAQALSQAYLDKKTLGQTTVPVTVTVDGQTITRTITPATAAAAREHPGPAARAARVRRRAALAPGSGPDADRRGVPHLQAEPRLDAAPRHEGDHVHECLR